MDEDLLIESWLVLKEYIKDKQQAADHWVNNLIDVGISDELLDALSGVDSYMEKAVAEYADDFDDDDLDFDEEF